jgi:hypothetical protein
MFRLYYAFTGPIDSFFKTLYSLLYLIILGKYFPKLKELKSEIKVNERCYIIGNGPSLQHDITGKELYLSQNVLFVVNHFSQSDLFEVLKPEFYVFADKAFWKYELCVESTNTKVEATLMSILKKTKWKMSLLIPNESFKFFNLYFRENSNIRIIAYNKTAVDGFKFFKFWAYRKNLSMPPAQTVLNAAIFIGINLGFKEINLLGADHTWHRNLVLRQDNVLCFIDDHFYDETKPELKGIPVNFLNEKTPLVHDELYAAAKALESHHKINEYAKSRNVTIYNLSSTTFVDAYERKIFSISN